MEQLPLFVYYDIHTIFLGPEWGLHGNYNEKYNNQLKQHTIIQLHKF